MPANYDAAFRFLMSNETYTGKDGSIVSHYEDPATGEISNWGISLKWLQTVMPEATADTVRALTEDQAKVLYQKYWWQQYKIGLIPSSLVASKLFDACVNMGAETAIKILQETLNEPLEEGESQVTVDGCIGPQVVNAVSFECKYTNGEQTLLDAFAANLATHYEQIVENNPVNKNNLDTWMKRE